MPAATDRDEPTGTVDPYGEMGQLFSGLAPGIVGKTMPKLPTVDEIIASYARA